MKGRAFFWRSLPAASRRSIRWKAWRSGPHRWATSACRCPLQIPRLFDLKLAAQSQTYCDEIKGQLAQHGIEITELSTHLQGQLLAVHPAYAEQFKAFAAPVSARQSRGLARMGRRAAAVRGTGQRATGPQGSRHVFRRAAVADDVSVAAAPGGPGGRRDSRNSRAAGGRCSMRSPKPALRLLRDPSRRRPARWRDLRAISRCGGRPPGRKHSL